jgi:hypothetical protein
MESESCISLSPEARTRLEGWVAGRNTPQKLVWRARIVLMWAQGALEQTPNQAASCPQMTILDVRAGQAPSGIPSIQCVRISLWFNVSEVRIMSSA